jgi:hypothetical protein
VQEIKEHLTCGLCSGPLAQSLVLSCSHLFCGDCLLKRLQQDGGITATQQSCPTCNMDLRAVPVRCLAMDKVAACIAATLPEAAQAAYAKRCRDGASAADQLNKMLWWLTPPAAVGGPLGGGPGGNTPAAGAGLLAGPHGVLAGGAFGGGSSMAMAAASVPPLLPALDPSKGGGAGMLPLAAHGLPYGAGLPPYGPLAHHHHHPPPGALPGPHHMGQHHPHHLAPSPNAASLLQMAMAAHMAQQAQQVAKAQAQLGAAAAAAAGLGGLQRPPDMAGLAAHAGGPGPGHLAPSHLAQLGHPPPATPSPTAFYDPQQLSGLMASMCHV